MKTRFVIAQICFQIHSFSASGRALQLRQLTRHGPCRQGGRGGRGGMLRQLPAHGWQALVRVAASCS